MKKIGLLVFLIEFVFINSFLAQNIIEKAVDEMMSETALKNASFSFRVIDVLTDSVLAEYNPNRSITSASTMKLVSTAAAIHDLGSYKQFSTRIEYTGIIDSNGVLQGDLFIRGGGDPTLGSSYFLKKNENPSDFMQTWVDTVKQYGIKKIAGRVVADARIFGDDMVPKTWVWGDLGNYYGAGPSGLTIYDNLTTLTFSSGENAGDSTEIICMEPYLPFIHFDNQVKAANTNSDNAYIFAAPYVPQKKITGTIPKNKEAFNVKGTIYDPPYQAAYDLEYFLLKNGITVTQNATTVRRLRLAGTTVSQNGVLIYEHFSPSIAEIVYWTNHESINLFAEHLLNQMGVKYYKEGSNYFGGLAVQNFWSEKINAEGMYVSDGSGLSRHNAVSAYHLSEILRYMTTSKYYQSFYSSLPVSGKSGTMRNIGKGTTAANNVRAKSGTMTRVKSYAGYATTKSGRKVAFAMIINNYNCYTSTVTNKLEKLMVAIADFNE